MRFSLTFSFQYVFSFSEVTLKCLWVCFAVIENAADWQRPGPLCEQRGRACRHALEHGVGIRHVRLDGVALQVGLRLWRLLGDAERAEVRREALGDARVAEEATTRESTTTARRNANEQERYGRSKCAGLSSHTSLLETNVNSATHYRVPLRILLALHGTSHP